MPEHSFGLYQTPIGQLALLEMLDLGIPSPFVVSYVGTHRRTEVQPHSITQHYPPRFEVGDEPIEHLRFALKHEAFDLRLMIAALEAIGADALEDWVRREPTGAYSRRAWFLFEHFTKQQLDLPPAKRGAYVPVLDEARFYVGPPRNSTRHRVVDNLLGTPLLCPMVRRTEKLETMVAFGWDEEARRITTQYDPTTLARAVHYLYTKETRSTYDIEREKPTSDKTERFVRALQDASKFNPSSKADLVALQNLIVDPRYRESDWRSEQNWVGETLLNYKERVHFICPKPEDVPALMEGWMRLTARLLEPGARVDAVIVAAVCAFAFVFIHPFEDGNGRIHRFLVHHVTAKRGFTPPGVVFPVSASILRDLRAYDATLETFSSAVMPFIAWTMTADQRMIVHNETRSLYRSFDATPLAEFLYDRVSDTVLNDLRQELEYLTRYDRMLEAIESVVDLPNKRRSLFVRLCAQNGGRLSKAKRAEFSELSDEEITKLETAVQSVI
jgi:Fic family protein